MTIHRISERRDSAGTLTHVMCCLCFEYTPIPGLYVDDVGLRWNLCHECGASERGESWRRRQ